MAITELKKKSTLFSVCGKSVVCIIDFRKWLLKFILYHTHTKAKLNVY